jgi:hypothetical protein
MRVVNELAREHMASVCHEAYRQYSATRQRYVVLPWSVTAKDKRDDEVAAVRYLTLHPNATPQHMHDHLGREKMKDGWKYGPEKSDINKTDPFLCAFEKLPEEQRTKARLFVAVTRALLEE